MSTLPRSDLPYVADDDPLLADLQCNLLAPHRRNRSVHLLLELPDDRTRARAYVQSWAAPGGVTPMREQLAADRVRWAAPPAVAKPGRGVVRSFMLSARGLRKLGFGLDPARTDDVSPDDAFRSGMRAREPRLFRNGPRPADTDFTATWRPPFDGAGGAIDAHLLLAADGPPVAGRACPAESPELTAAVAAARTALAAAHGRVVHRFDGYEGHNGAGQPIEHFGFRDGVSNPLFLAADWSYAATHQPTPYFGHGLGNVLFPLPRSAGYGTHCVFRQIEQDVAGFSALTATAAERLIGRRRDGTSLVPGARAGRELNEFNYAADPAGAGCPFHAHVRKSNPRGSSAFAPMEPAQLFARRGMLYGDRPHDPAVGFTGLPETAAGLLFMGYVAHVEDQFEHLHNAWFADSEFPVAGAGFDELVALTDPRTLPAFTTVRGGEHFFVPPVSWLANPR